MYRTIRLSLGEIEIRATVAWLLVAVALLAISIYVTVPERLSGVTTTMQLSIPAIVVAGLAASLALHEIAHVAVARRGGGALVALSPQLAGALPDTLFEAHDPASEVRVGLAGPLASWLLAGLFGALWWAGGGLASDELSDTVGLLALANAGLAVVSLMPGYPFDGGRVARGFFWYLNGDLMSATRIVGYSGYVIIMAAMASGAFLVVNGGNYAVWGVWVLVTAFMINRSVGAGISHIFWAQNSRRLRVDDLFIGGTRRIQSSVTIDEAIERLLEGHEDGPMLVFDGDMAVGMIELSSIRPVPRRQWTEKTMGDVMTSIEGLRSTTSSSGLIDLIDLLPPDKESVALITRNGSVIGATDRRDVVRRLQQYLAAERLEQMRRRRR